MKTLLNFLLGYCIFEINSNRIKDVLNILSKNNIRIINFSILADKAVFKVPLKDKKRSFVLLNDAKLINVIGLPEIFSRYKHRIGLTVGTVAFLVIIFLSPLFIWNIEIIGIDRLSREYVDEILSEAGVKIGAFSPKIVRSDIYKQVLTQSNEISWISVNFIGSTAKVEIIERDYSTKPSHQSDAANIIASEDGQIVDINVVKGRRVVTNNAVVKKGELLVSGVYDSTRMGTRYVYSNAMAFARVLKDFSVEIPLKTFKKQYIYENITEIRLKIFGKSINIFKNYSKTTDDYDIINRKESVPILGFKFLPIVWETTTAFNYKNVPITLSQNQAIDMAKAKIKQLIFSQNFEEIFATESHFELENDVLTYFCRVDAIKNISQISEFDID